jgi:formiminotetrahydrofolate cyclodeaminase
VRDDTITDYLGKLAERTAAPAGGATAAMNAAQAAALLAMTARYCDGPAHAGPSQ